MEATCISGHSHPNMHSLFYNKTQALIFTIDSLSGSPHAVILGKFAHALDWHINELKIFNM